MKPKDDLFRLIKSLSRSEKRYFTLDAKKSGSKSSQYLKLFQAINAMNEYDESLFPKDFSNISVGKAYLYEAILRSMRDYRSPKSKRAQLKQRIMDAKFLYERGLYNQGTERLHAAKKLAEELDDSLALLEINREERQLTKEIGIADFSNKFESFKFRKFESINAVTDEFKYLDIYDFLGLEFSTKFRLSKKNEIEDFKTKMNQAVWEEPKEIQGKLRYFQSNAFYHHLIGEAETAVKFFQKSAELWDENPVLKREEYFRYIKDLANAIAFSFYAGKIESVEVFLEKLEKEPAGNFHEENLKFRTLTSHKINYLVETRRFEKALELEQEVEKGLAIFDVRDTTKLTFWIQTASLMMTVNNLKRSKFWLKKIIEFKDLSVRQDIQKGARVLNLLLEAETMDYDAIELLIRAYIRFFKINYFEEGKFSFETELLILLKSIIPFPLEKKERKKILAFYNQKKEEKAGGLSLQVLEGWLIHSGIKN